MHSWDLRDVHEYAYECRDRGWQGKEIDPALEWSESVCVDIWKIATAGDDHDDRWWRWKIEDEEKAGHHVEDQVGE